MLRLSDYICTPEANRLYCYVIIIDKELRLEVFLHIFCQINFFIQIIVELKEDVNVCFEMRVPIMVVGIIALIETYIPSVNCNFYIYRGLHDKIRAGICFTFNPFNAETMLSSKAQERKIFENHLNPVMLVSIG